MIKQTPLLSKYHLCLVHMQGFLHRTSRGFCVYWLSPTSAVHPQHGHTSSFWEGLSRVSAPLHYGSLYISFPFLNYVCHTRLKPQISICK